MGVNDMLIEKLADGRTLMDKQGLKSYLLDSLCDEIAEDLDESQVTTNISVFFFALDNDDRESAIMDAVDSLFIDTGNPSLDRVFDHLFGMKLERKGRFFYAKDMDALPTQLSLVDDNG